MQAWSHARAWRFHEQGTVASMYVILLACRDLMVASRLELQADVEVRRIGDPESLFAALNERPHSVVVVDLMAFPSLPAELASEHAPSCAAVIAFAPHVHVDLLEEARPFADLVVPRGAVVKSLTSQVDRALERRAARGN